MNKIAYVFPGQGSQFVGMGKDLYESNEKAKAIFDKANDVLGFPITETMFNGSLEELKETKITQPAIFIHSAAVWETLENKNPAMTAGHSLGEFTALYATGVLNFESALKLVSQRANAMQEACEHSDSTMAAVLGLDNETVENICSEFNKTVVPANYNCPGQVVISGATDEINEIADIFKEKGAKRVVVLPVSGGFHSEFMLPAKEKLAASINTTEFKTPICPIYQNIVASAINSPEEIKKNLIEQLTGSVKWTQSVQKMIGDGAEKFIEVGPGKVLQGLVKKIDRSSTVESALG